MYGEAGGLHGQREGLFLGVSGGPVESPRQQNKVPHFETGARPESPGNHRKVAAVLP
jgi:hypothetical protein